MRARKQSALRRTRLRVAYKYPATAAKASRRFSLSSPSHASSHRYLTLEIIQRRPAVFVGDHHCLLAHDRISVRASRRQKRIGHRFSHFKCFYYAKRIEWRRPFGAGPETRDSFPTVNEEPQNSFFFLSSISTIRGLCCRSLKFFLLDHLFPSLRLRRRLLRYTSR